MNAYKTKKLKHGVIGIAITALVLVVALAFNIVFTLVAKKNLLYIDMSSEQFFEVTDDMAAYLDELDPEENNIIIYFLQEADLLTSMTFDYSNEYYKEAGYDESYYSSNTWGMGFVHRFALVLAEKYSFISVDYLDMEDDADFLDNFRSTVGSELGVQDVIIDNYAVVRNDDGSAKLDENGNEIRRHNFRICNRDAFFTFEEEAKHVFAFNGYYRFAATIMSLSGSTPVVYFTTGHGEKVGDPSDPDDFGKAQGLVDLFLNAGFDSRKIDLSTDYNTLLNDTRGRILVVFGPDSDFDGYEAETTAVNEISVIRKYVNAENHNLMVFVDPDTPALPNLDEYMKDYWGVSFDDNLVYSKVGDDHTIFADYVDAEDSVGANLTSSLTSLDSLPTIVFNKARTISVSAKYLELNGIYENNATKYTGPAFITPTDSEAHYKDGTIVSFGNSVISGDAVSDPASLLTLSYETWHNSNNENIPTYVLCCGTTDFASTEILEDSSYGNSDVLFYATRLMGKENQPWEIDFIVCNSEGLETITETAVIMWNIFICGVFPVIAIVAGVVVFYKRRHL